ncbi:MAG: hypothetical protein MUE54_02930 [Anaerolineae bacterium]|jgi:hypothetical protein|nr:hypothetical protein [Anaerolineae bacterium]
MKINRVVLFLIGLIPFLVVHSSADFALSTMDDSKLEFTSIQNIEDLVIANITPIRTDNTDRIYTSNTTLSPNGDFIIFYRRPTRDTQMLCEYSFSSNASICVDGDAELPEFFGGFWSADSRYVVLNSDLNTLRLAQESDLTIYDTQTDTIINRTDDGVSVRESMFDEDVRNRIWIDIAPIFAPNGDLYFFRNAIDPSVDEWRADLMRIPAGEITGTSAPEALWRHPAIGAFTIFRTTNWYLDGSMSISPNGQYLAIASINVGQPDDTTNGIWLFDLTEKTVKTHIPISRLGESLEGLPIWLTQRMSEIELKGIFPTSLAWASDNNTLVIRMSNDLYYSEFFVPTFKYDVTADKFTSVYDFTAISEDDYKPESTLFDDVSLLADVNPTLMVMSPSHQALFYIGRDAITDTFVLSAISLVESGFVTPRRIATLTDYIPMNHTVTSIGYTAPTLRILTDEQLITLTEQ